MPHPFEITKELVLDATPDEVWQAIATGPGIDSWFMGRNEVDSSGGVTRMTTGEFTTEGTITGWEPPNRLALRTPEAPTGEFMAYEYLVEAREGGTAVLRLVHNGFLGDDWEEQYDALNPGWDMYLHKLAEYLTHFRGRTATPIFAAQPDAGSRDHVLAVLRSALSIPDSATVGDPVKAALDGLPQLEGVLDYLAPNFIGIRTDDALYRFIYGMHHTVVLGHHLFAPGVDEDETEIHWQLWLTRTLAGA
jgi:uncharacterized protein YndB with AHSA1/START domain